MADPQIQIRQWLDLSLKSHGSGAARQLASELGVSPEAVSRMRNTNGFREMRRIEADLIPAMAQFFGSIPPGFEPIAEIKCKTCPDYGRNQHWDGGVASKKEIQMPSEVPKHVTVKIETPQQGALVVGDNNTVTIQNSQVATKGPALSAEQALHLDNAAKEVAATRHVDTTDVWAELCSALDVPDSALITREMYPAADKILTAWKARATREAVNQKGG